MISFEFVVDRGFFGGGNGRVDFDSKNVCVVCVILCVTYICVCYAFLLSSENNPFIFTHNK